jgi:hypothetical protein
MADVWPATVTYTCELGSQRGTPYDDEINSFSDQINAYLRLGWRVLNTYVENKGPESTHEECVCLLGWTQDGEPKYPRRCDG